ncbi:basic salivary proline-rich protein 2-like [Mustela lutreola]|uniref:basic salivary proline-rich protein 2-like n=1 Tax=Mustela lutreola TaxID=9666 RepID=UPI00279779CF|nr:basic salivary proline-rich protein 2-like [Mustela lutreola]
MQATPKGLAAALDTAPHPRPVPAFPTPNPEALRLPARGGARAEAPPLPRFATAQIPEPESVKCGEPAFHTGTVRLKACTQGWRRPTKAASSPAVPASETAPERRAPQAPGGRLWKDVRIVCFLPAFSEPRPARPCPQGPRGERSLLGARGDAHYRGEGDGPATEAPPDSSPDPPSYRQAPDCVRAPRTKLPRAQGLPPSSGALPARYSQARLQAEQGARGPRGEQQHQSQGHRAPRRPRLREDGHRARGPAPGPRSGPPLTGGPGGPSEPPPPRAPWPGDAQGAAAGARRAPGRRRCGRSGSPPARVRLAPHCGPSRVAGARPPLPRPRPGPPPGPRPPP